MASYLDEYTDGKHKSATNREYKFERAVDSFINQSYKNSELIIVSDGCEKTNKIYNEKYSSYNNIKLISLDKQPLFSGNVRQAGIKSATGDLICYLDSDDIFDPEHLSTIDKCVTKQHQWFFYNDYLYDGKQKQMRDVIPQFSRIGTSSFCHKKSLNVKWVDGYNHDWKTIESIIKKPHLKISTPGYLVCHQQAYNLDY
jgi:glycosyltransferase involved in cell wall biosynthesis